MNYIGEISKDSSLQIGEDNRGIVITMRSDQMLFEPGSSEIEAARVSGPGPHSRHSATRPITWSR